MIEASSKGTSNMLRLRCLAASAVVLGSLIVACGGDDTTTSGAVGDGGPSGDSSNIQGMNDGGPKPGTDGGGPGADSGTTNKDGGNGADAGNGSDAGKDAGPMSCAPKCAVGDKCGADTDCASGACDADGLCAMDAAHDHKQDKGESDIDCGGNTTDGAPKCTLGKTCVNNADCMNNNCGAAKTCSTPHSQDGIQDDGESDIDCGGNTTDGAPLCGVGKMCVLDNDCASGACGADLKCATSGATDGKQDFGESAIDCGGNTTDGAPKCDLNQGCVLNNDCTSGYCSIGNVCVANGYSDGKQDFGESDVDCGGNTTDGAPTCGLTQKCVLNNDCTSTFCSVANACVANGYSDGKKDFGESDIDCGGHSTDGAPLCPDGSTCADSTDCVNAFCNPGNSKCVTPTSNDGIQDGTETDIDCGGGAPTNAPACPPGKKCKVGGDCTVGGCNYKGICPTAISCTGQYGGDTCGAPGTPDDCCATLPAVGLPAGKINGVSVTTTTIDKYNVTAGRFRAFAIATNGDIRTWILNHKPAWWNDSWTDWLPTELDDGGANPACCGAVVANDNICTSAGNVGEACGLYQELGPNVHGKGAVGANEGCVIANYGARSFRLPDAVNAKMSDIQVYSQDEDDQRAMQCVTSYIEAAFCAWDGGHLPTTTQIDYLWHGTTYPWGINVQPGWAGYPNPPAWSVTTTPPNSAGAPAGYLFANDVDPQNGVRGSQPSYGQIAYGDYSNTNSGHPLGGTAPNVTAQQLTDLQWANYDFNYWGGLSQTYVGTCASTGKLCSQSDACVGGPGGKCPQTAADQTLFIAPPGRFPNGNGFYGHADLGGNVFNALDMASGANGNTQWSNSGSWQGHPIPWQGGRVNVPSYYKYWAMGARCAR
jgi:hypothetical protein